MPSFAELKERAAKAKDASVNRLQSTRDKYSSQSSKNISWDANHKRPPPVPSAAPGHARNNSRAATMPPPPPPQRTPVVRSDTRPTATPSPTLNEHTSHKRSKSEGLPRRKVDWKNLSKDDKRVFFGWLDEFFGRKLKIKLKPRKRESIIRVADDPATPSTPPTIPTWSRPSQASLSGQGTLEMSHPPPTHHGSSALDLALYFAPDTPWDSAWYLTAELPPPLQEHTPPTYATSWEQRGPHKTVFGGILFADLSMVWYSVQFDTTNPDADPNDPSAVQRSAKYLPRPAPKDRAALLAAHETYGETVAAFAEGYAGSGEYCARGECWDLANEALRYFDAFEYVPKPVPSISRTHGHLIFCGKAGSGGNWQDGRWRGGDDRVRRGDIVEWRRVRVGMPGGGYTLLGDPDHTAVVVRDAVPSRDVADGAPLLPRELGALEVVEQSVGSPPARARYDLGMLQEGEMWVYRPIAMEAYVGCLLAPQCPEGVEAMTI
ncbi:CHAP domain-containing protein [Phanerochaete sordida]|uniref:CHAP domain-containing protein n=1 Tax=Phanerochaete sordida TaxID=48140 RepID=A0A9P3LBU4_9APHY|nr:CHAP domain-containing protein [Phanerochaete sordida]